VNIRQFLFILLLSTLLVVPLKAQNLDDKCSPLLNHEVKQLLTGEPINLCDAYSGKVIMIVNTASKCAFTPQYEQLELLYDTYKARGMVVLGFPSNDFGRQEPGTEKQIQNFCRLTYGVRFPMFAKTRAAKAYADPLYRALGEAAGRYPSWNFHKYLLNREGQLVRDFTSSTSPDSKQIIKAIEALL
jgi:glutathione peroxidase